MKLELQERGSILDANTDELLSEEDEGEFDEQSESASQEYQQELGDFGKRTAENETMAASIDNDKDDLNGEDNIQQKVKNVKKPKRTEYKVIRQVIIFNKLLVIMLIQI